MPKLSAIALSDGSTTNRILKKSKGKPRRARYFFVSQAILFPVVAFLGFFPSFQSLNKGTLEIHWLTHIHSTIMTSWLLLYFTQAVLAASGNLKIHRRLGVLSVVLGILVVLVMALVSFNIVIANHPPEASFLFDLLLTDFYEILCFALFFTWGMLVRKKNSRAHKRLLTLATIVLLTAAVDRIQRNGSFPSFGMEYPAFSFIYSNILLIPLFLYDLFSIRRFHKITLFGTAIMIFFQIAVSKTYNSLSWHRFWYAHTAPFMEKLVEVKLNEAQSAPLLGEYESEIGHLTISRNNDKLYLQFNGDQQLEMGAKSDTELFLKGETMNFLFTKGSDGNIKQAKAKMIGRIYEMTKVK